MNHLTSDLCMDVPALEVSDLFVNYDRTPVLWDISVSIPQGTITGIIGPNGAGKSTFIKALLQLTPSINGKILFLNKPYSEIKQQISYVPQRGSVDWEFPITVKELVAMGAYGKKGLFSWLSKKDFSKALSYMKLLQIDHLASRQIDELSGGQQQRAFLARALMQESSIYLLDEPFAGIDLNSEKIIISQLQKMRDEKKTILVVHHDLSTVPQYFDWTLILNMRLVSCGPTETAFKEKALSTAYGRTHSMFKEAVALCEKKEAGRG